MQHKDSNQMKHILDFSERFYILNGRSPSTAEIGAQFGISKVTAYRYLLEMNDKGMISYDGASIITPRTSLAKHGVTTASIFRGAIPCGSPEVIEASVDQYVLLPSALFGNGTLYIIYAKGDSMIEAGIEDGDMVVVDAEKPAAIGDKVVALDGNGQSTLKTLRYDEAKSRYYLHPENSRLPDIYVDELIVQGVVRYIIKPG